MHNPSRYKNTKESFDYIAKAFRVDVSAIAFECKAPSIVAGWLDGLDDVVVAVDPVRKAVHFAKLALKSQYHLLETG